MARFNLDEQYSEVEPEYRLAYRFGIRFLWVLIFLSIVFATCSSIKGAA